MLYRIGLGLRAIVWASPLLLLAACQVIVKHSDSSCDDGTCEPTAAAIVSWQEPKLCKEPSMHAMASDLDHLENHIDWYGSVTAKTPDVWGQARLTSYRQETEKRLRNELDGFKVSQQGSIDRTDTADLLVRLTIGNTGKPDDAAAAAEANAKAAEANAKAAETNAKTATAAADTAKSEAVKIAAAVKALEDATKKLEEAAKKPSVVTVGTDSSATDPNGIVSDALTKGTALEPVRILDQKDRYLSHLNQHRRKNEGDDTSDAPGYSLNLVRIPVSLLPGKKTDRGYGAEMTFTINPILDDELLKTTFRELVINDLLHLMAFPLTKVNEDPVAQKMFQTVANSDGSTRSVAPVGHNQASTTDDLFEVRLLTPNFKSLLDKQSRQLSYTIESKGTRSIPPTQLPDVIGSQLLYEVAKLVYTLTEHSRKERGGFAHMPDVQAVLREHLIAAYRWLERPELADVWDTYCLPDMVKAVRCQDTGWLMCKQVEFLNRMNDPNRALLTSSPNTRLAVIALAWAIVVDSALLNVRLMDDMKRTESVAGVVFNQCAWPKYYLPDPSPEDRQTFNEYVRRRWPIHVFTLDPATDEQNLADSLTSVRNTQLALTLAFIRGKMSTNAFVNATRRVQSQYETIALNRTQVGFAHGDNTFGWRFYPRFQTPPVRGNIQTFIGGNLLGINNPRDGIRTRELEPGPRECVAVVLMPSFVPNATLDAVGNWFALANPKHKVLDHTQALHLSRTVQVIRTDGCGVKDSHKYRDEDHRLLMTRAEQLSARLPMQTMRFQVPTVNSYGGFELFGNSTTDLAPELYGWYGAPGLKPGQSTTLFLVGDHFSVNHTRILVGNVDVTDYQMLSRQVMKVTVPSGVLPLPNKWTEKCDTPHVHIHLATPYGVSRELEIPVVCDPAKCPPDTAAAALTTPPPAKPKPDVKGTMSATLNFESTIERPNVK